MHKLPTQTSHIQTKIQAVEQLVEALRNAANMVEKLEILDRYPHVQEFLTKHPALTQCLNSLSPEDQYLMKSVIALGQGPIVFRNFDDDKSKRLQLIELLNNLAQIERFYSVIGGIIGYHLTVLKLIVERDGSQRNANGVSYHMPVGLDISQDTEEVRNSIRQGIASIKNMAEIYPVGGSGDRLDLHDDATGEALPVASLPFGGRPLLEGLIQDLQAREYLYYKIYDEQLDTPIAMMTSLEKNNHQNIIALCRDHQWFGRDPDSIRFFTQPLVPVLTIEGDWVMRNSFVLMMKPGGHGVIWKLAKNEGIFDWLLSKNRTHALVRQINNPIAGTDYGLIAFLGYGNLNKKIFGFASCQRRLNAPEGMDVLTEVVGNQGVDYCITNIEYTEFEQQGIHDVPVEPGGQYSKFPANTNILFVDLKAIQPIVETCPVPGMLINMKNSVKMIDGEGRERTIAAGRLESTMQNIADYIVDQYPKKPDEVTPAMLSSYITFNERKKTLSVTKKAAKQDGSLLDTPEGCFYEMQQNQFELLTRFCGMKVPDLGNEQHYRQRGPEFIVRLHPAIGPLYRIIAQKIYGGSLSIRSELQLEIAEVEIKNLNLDGSLLVVADSVMGKKNEKGKIEYSQETGKCILRSVTVNNKGIDREAQNNFAMNQISRKEAFRIILHGNGEFFAENVVFSGNIELEVRDGHRMVAFMRGDAIHYRVEKIAAPTWFWKYSFAPDDQIALKKEAPHIV